MFVLTIIENDLESGEAFLYNTEEEGKQMLKTKYKEKIHSIQPLNEENTYIKKGGRYAVVCNYMKIIEYRLIEII